MGYICFAIGLVIIALAVYFAFQNRNDTSKWIFCTMIGILFSTFFMVLQTEWIPEGKTFSNGTLYTLLSCLIYSLKTLGGGQDLTRLETMPLTGVIKSVYICVNYLAFLVAPVLASSLLLSFFGDIGGRIQYFLRVTPKSKCSIFSEINENSLALARGIKKSPRRKTLVFCNTKNVDKALVTQAKALGAILLYKPCKDIRATWRFSKYEFYLISAREDVNISLAESIIAENIKTDPAKTENGKIAINAFIETGANVRLLEEIEKPGTIELHCIDEIALFCNELIYEHPLYRTKQHGNHISVAIVGCGRTGMRMLKTVYWAGQIEDYTLKIRVYDKDADKAEARFHQQCPGLKGEKTIQFVKADVETLDFREKLLETNNSPDATYIVVAMGDDRLNISVSDELYKIYRRSNYFEDDKMPEIFARVRSNTKTQTYIHNADFLTRRHIHLFGTPESIFTRATLFHSDLENLALAVHLAYWQCLHAAKDSAEYKEALLAFKTDEYNRRSSMASALHIPAKLLMCDENTGNIKDFLSEEAAEVVKNYSERIRDPKELERVAKNEHRRWNAFFLSEGYQTASREEMLQYSRASHNHKDLLSMLHPCITDWDSLDDIAEAFNRAHGKNKDFKELDVFIIQSIPEIIQAAKKRKEEN